MPKLIKDIKIKILKVSMDLFETIGYENLSMRKISEKADIAVGTLYNYFPNKKSLFLEILEISWLETLTQLKVSVKNVIVTNESNSKVSIFIQVLYDSIANRKGLGRDLFYPVKINEHSIKIDVFSNILAESNTILKNLIIEEYGYSDKLALRKTDATLSIIGTLFFKYPEDRDFNITFLINQI